MFNSIRHLPTMFVALLGVLVATERVDAQSCQPVLQAHVDWINNQAEGAGTYSLNMVFVSNVNNGTATYGEGSLDYGWGALAGTAQLYRNIDRWGSPSFPPFPFDPAAVVAKNVIIWPQSGEAWVGSTKMVLVCDRPGVLYGSPAGHVSPMYIFSLRRSFTPTVF